MLGLGFQERRVGEPGILGTTSQPTNFGQEENTPVLFTGQETEHLTFLSCFGLWGLRHLSLPGVGALGAGEAGMASHRPPSSQLQG